MESVSVRGKAKGPNEKVSLEDYLLLLQSNSDPHLTVPQLNQIIGMHGFKKIFRVPKKLLTETVNSMSLVEPARSTIKDHISPGSITATVDNVMADLDDLNWKECCVTSVVTVTSWKNATVSAPPPSNPRNDVVHHLHHSNLQPLPPLALESSPYCDPPPKKPVPKGKSRRSSGGGDGGGAPETAHLPVKQVRKKRLSKGGDGGGASETGHLPTKQVQKKKRSSKGGGGGAPETAIVPWRKRSSSGGSDGGALGDMDRVSYGIW